MGGRLGGQCWGYVIPFRGRWSLLAPLFPAPHHLLSSTGNLDGLLTGPIPLPPTFSLPCPAWGAPGVGRCLGRGQFGGVLAVTGPQALRTYF